MNRRLAIGLGGVAALVALVGCASLSPAPPVIAVKQVCVPIKEYTPAEQKAAGAALAALEPTNPLIGFVLDYKAMRDMDRVCIASTQGKP